MNNHKLVKLLVGFLLKPDQVVCLLSFQAGMILDNGVKTTEANDKDKRPFLSLIGARSGLLIL